MWATDPSISWENLGSISTVSLAHKQSLNYLAFGLDKGKCEITAAFCGPTPAISVALSGWGCI